MRMASGVPWGTAARRAMADGWRGDVPTTRRRCTATHQGGVWTDSRQSSCDNTSAAHEARLPLPLCCWLVARSCTSTPGLASRMAHWPVSGDAGPPPAPPLARHRGGLGTWHAPRRMDTRARCLHRVVSAWDASQPCAVEPPSCGPTRDRVESALTRLATGCAHGPRAQVLARLAQEGTPWLLHSPPG
jgi:hypothetical protein